MWTEHEKLKTIGACLEGADDRGRDPDRVKHPHIGDLVIELDSASARGLDWKQISTWAGHGDVRQTWNRYGHLVPGGEEQARERLDAYLTPPPVTTVAQTVAHDPENAETPENTGVLKYRYRDSNPGFRRERAAS